MDYDGTESTEEFPWGRLSIGTWFYRQSKSLFAWEDATNKEFTHD